MNSSRRIIARSVVLLLILLIAIEGTANMILHRTVPFSLEERRDGVYAVRVSQRDGASELQAGDRILVINGVKIKRLADALWQLGQIAPGQDVSISAARNNREFTTEVKANRPLPISYMILDRLTGLSFLALGLLVGWTGVRTAEVRSFYRVNVFAGLAVLLLQKESPYSVEWLKNFHASLFLLTYSMTPAFLIDFVHVYTHPDLASRTLAMRRFLIFVPFALIAAAALLSYQVSLQTQSNAWIQVFDLLHRKVFAVLLTVTVLLIAGWMIHCYLVADRLWDRIRYRWLLLCTLAGICPYVFLDKFPTVLGLSPLLPQGLSMSLLVIAPIGWGMAVASFHMLKIEWTLSRTVVYFVAAGLVIYIGVSLATVMAEYARSGSEVSTTAIWLLGLVAAGLAAWALIKPVQRTVDRLYYGDWFDARQTVRALSNELTATLQRSCVEEIISHRLPNMLQLQSCRLLARDEQLNDGDLDLWTRITEIRDVIVFKPHDTLMKSGFRAALPLIHGTGVVGCVLLGAKSSGAPYSYRDRELLRSLSSVGGMALANVELNERLLDQERRSAISELAAGIAHEINNALSPVLGHAQLIERITEQSDTAKADNSLLESSRVIADMCRRIRQIADNLKDLTKPNTMQPRRIGINDVANEALHILTETAGRIKRFRPDDPEAPFRLRREFDPANPVLFADPDLLLQVFINLIVNACDAMVPQGHGLLTVGTQKLGDQNTIVGYVEDDGAGIPSDMLDKIFLPYFTTKPKDQGTGLGLSLVRSIIEAHGGFIKVTSKPPGGTRFEFLLPCNDGETGSG